MSEEQRGLRRVRVRWAAIGAALAVSLGGGIGLVNASLDSGDRPVYQAISPCRLLDLRPGNINVGPRDTPLGADETMSVVAQGEQGNCKIPSDAVALAVNATALDATAPTFVTFFPGDVVTPPSASHLNPVPDAPPTPNMVNVSLSAAGEFNVYNFAGEVNLIVDVAGYYVHHTHPEYGSASSSGGVKDPTTEVLTSDDETVLSTAVSADAPGVIVAHFSARASTGVVTTSVTCSISDTADTPDATSEVQWTNAGNSSGSVSGTQIVKAPGGSDVDLHVVCRTNAPSASVQNVVLTYTYSPD